MRRPRQVKVQLTRRLGPVVAVVLLSLPLRDSPTGLAAGLSTHEVLEKSPRYVSAEEQLDLPESEVNYGLAALVLTNDYVPNYEISRGLRQLDEISGRVRELLAGQPDGDEPLVRIGAINTVLFREYQFQYDMEGFPKQTADKRLLGNLLRRGKGTCANLPDLYYAVAERLGFPIYMVEAPQHAFLRYQLPDGAHINIEATAGGGRSSDEDYIAEMEIPGTALESGTFMRTLTRREALLLLVEERTWHEERTGNLERVLVLAELLRRQRPEHAPTFWNSALSSVVAGRAIRGSGDSGSAGQASERYFRDAREFARKANEFGITKPDNRGDYAKRQESIRSTRLGERAAPIPPSEPWDAVAEVDRLIASPPNRELDWATAFLKPTVLSAELAREIERLDERGREAQELNRYNQRLQERARNGDLLDPMSRSSQAYQAEDRQRNMDLLMGLNRFPPGSHPQVRIPGASQ